MSGIKCYLCLRKDICKETYVQKRYCKRWNFEKEIKDFKSILNWYRDTVDFQFANPIRPLHMKLGVLEEIPEKNRKITIEQVQKFLKALDPKIRDLAVVQFFCGARIGEIAGLQVKNIDLENRVLTIKEVMVWINGKPKIKPCPKNGQSREVFINDTMLAIFERRKKDLPGECPFIFHKKGRPYRYNYLDHKYNEAWKASGLIRYSGTHLVRYAAAQSSRRITGSIDGAKAVTGHVSMALAHKYSDYGNIEQNRSSVEKLEQALLGRVGGASESREKTTAFDEKSLD